MINLSMYNVWWCFQDLYKKTRSILNKLTPQKFQILVSQMQALKIDSENKLKGVIDLVFEKVIVTLFELLSMVVLCKVSQTVSQHLGQFMFMSFVRHFCDFYWLSVVTLLLVQAQ